MTCIQLLGSAGVHRHVTELGQVRQGRYNLAVALVTELDFIVIDSHTTARIDLKSLAERRRCSRTSDRAGQGQPKAVQPGSITCAGKGDGLCGG